MYYIFSVLIVIVCILLVLIVLVQKSKGGGLSANLTSSNQGIGVRKTADFLEKATWTLAASLLALSLFASLTIPRADEEEQKKSMIEDQINNMAAPSDVPNFPTQAPQQKPQQEESTLPEE